MLIAQTNRSRPHGASVPPVASAVAGAHRAARGHAKKRGPPGPRPVAARGRDTRPPETESPSLLGTSRRAHGSAPRPLSDFSACAVGVGAVFLRLGSARFDEY
jgi:hypothetical protein